MLHRLSIGSPHFFLVFFLYGHTLDCLWMDCLVILNIWSYDNWMVLSLIANAYIFVQDICGTCVSGRTQTVKLTVLTSSGCFTN